MYIIYIHIYTYIIYPYKKYKKTQWFTNLNSLQSQHVFSRSMHLKWVSPQKRHTKKWCSLMKLGHAWCWILTRATVKIISTCKNYTPPETNSSPLKMDGWNTSLSYWGFGLFSGAKMLVSGRVDVSLMIAESMSSGLSAPNFLVDLTRQPWVFLTNVVMTFQRCTSHKDRLWVRSHVSWTQGRKVLVDVRLFVIKIMFWTFV